MKGEWYLGLIGLSVSQMCSLLCGLAFNAEFWRNDNIELLWPIVHTRGLQYV